MRPPNPKKVPFQQVVNALLDEAHPFPPIYLHRFSGLDKSELEQVRAIWSKIAVRRRRALLEDLEDLSDADTLVSFDSIALHALDDSDAHVRALAIRLLWENEDRFLILLFLEMAEDDPDAEVRSTAATALGYFVYLGELEEIPADVLHDLEDRLLAITRGSDQPIVRRRALEALGYSGRPEVPELLRAAYQTGDPEWLASALFAMGRSADESWAESVLAMLDHPNPRIRQEAARAAGELALGAARERLLSMLEDSDEDVMNAAIWSLSQIGGDEVRPALERLLEDIEDDEEADLIEDALDNLSFTEDMALYDLFDYLPDGDEDTLLDVGEEPSGGDDELDETATK